MIGFVVILIFVCVAEAIIGAYFIINQRDRIAGQQSLINAFHNANIERQALTPVCTCEHGYSFHDENGCHQTVKWEIRDYLSTRWGGFTKHIECRCKTYVGPEPLPTYYHPLEIGN